MLLPWPGGMYGGIVPIDATARALPCGTCPTHHEDQLVLRVSTEMSTLDSEFSRECMMDETALSHRTLDSGVGIPPTRTIYE